MSTTTPATAATPLAELSAAGTSVWLDSIRRAMFGSGELQRLVSEDSVVGMTSNPSIFQKAILGSTDYDERLAELAADGRDAADIYDDLAIADVQAAADVLRPVYDATDGRDGLVSLEVLPGMAHDTAGSIAAARDYWQRLDRPNVMIKIPGTEEGVDAIRESIAAGININVTLLFSLHAYARVADAYLTGLEERAARGEPIDRIASVASFFVSRVDTAVDRRLAALGREDLAGRAAVANARLAYAAFEEQASTERWAGLRERGARPQRLLWASTGTKNPSYSDVKYVAELAGPDTVNTMPMATLQAYAEHGTISQPLLPDAAESARAELEDVRRAGVSLEEVTAELLDEGIESFTTALQELMAGIERRRTAVVAGEPAGTDAQLTEGQAEAIGARVRWARERHVIRRVWRRDHTLWGHRREGISDRLGWLTIADQTLEHLDGVLGFVEEVRAAGFTDCVLLGMGGSSLAPEVIRRTFGSRDGYLRLHVLDSTHPDAIAELTERLDLQRTLFLVSSKSGTTLEPRSFAAYFLDRVGDPSHFVAITDPGTELEREAREQGFRRCFAGAPDIGGRYSALSAFGIVPAALMGVDVRALLQRAEVAVHAAHPEVGDDAGGALWVGLALGQLARDGRDKLTFVVDEPLSSFGLWVEQLVAESTGKEGTGIVPVAGEPLGAPAVYGADRVFVRLRHQTEPDTEADERLDALAGAGHPVIMIPFEEPLDLGAQFFSWELAVAVAGAVLEINPFDQPNVQEAKDLTVKTIEAYRAEGHFDPEGAAAVDAAGAAEPLRELLERAGAGAYVAIMAYVPGSKETDAALSALRVAIRDARHVATTVGYGPRFLHSTGQLHKGGPPSGVFLQLTGDGRAGVEVPGARYDFGALVQAQAIGDGQALRSRGLPFLRVHLTGDPASAVQSLVDEVSSR